MGELFCFTTENRLRSAAFGRRCLPGSRLFRFLGYYVGSRAQVRRGNRCTCLTSGSSDAFACLALTHTQACTHPTQVLPHAAARLEEMPVHDTIKGL
eukprot:scaffold160482_cov32-Tisochrysis_lutea.AAC.2